MSDDEPDTSDGVPAFEDELETIEERKDKVGKDEHTMSAEEFLERIAVEGAKKMMDDIEELSEEELFLLDKDLSPDGESEKERVYREYHKGDATIDDVREVFGGDMDEFEQFQTLMQLVEESTTNEATDDLFSDSS